MAELLSIAELVVLASAVGGNGSPWAEGSALMDLDRPLLVERLGAAREGLLLRGLASTRDDGALRVTAPLDGLIGDAPSAKVGFEVLHAQAGAPASRVQFGLAGDSVVAHVWHGIEEHSFERLASPVEIAAWVMRFAPPHESPGLSRAYSVPHAVMTALAKTPPEPADALRAQLVEAGVPTVEADSLLRAGLTPERQSVFMAMRLGEDRLQARALMWFADAQSSWLIGNFDAGGRVELQTANPAEVERAIAAVVAATAQRS